MSSAALWIFGTARLFGIFLTAPFFSALPWRLRWTVPAAFAWVLPAVLHGPGGRNELHGAVDWAVPLVGELALGAAMGWGACLALGALCGAAELSADSMGVAMGGSLGISPVALDGEGGAALKSLYGLLGAMVFLLLDLHHVVLCLVAESFQVFPPGQLALVRLEGSLGVLLDQTASGLFEAAVCVGFPVLSALLLVGIAQAFLARVLPEADFFVLGPAVRSATGLAVILVSLPFFVETSRSLFQGTALAGRAALQAVGR